MIFLNGTPFFITMSHSIQFVTVEHFPNHKANQLSKFFKRVGIIYSRSSIVVQIILVDIYFDKTINYMMDNVILNTSAVK